MSNESMAERMKHGPRAQQEQMMREAERRELTEDARRIGAYLEANPPWGMKDRFSASGWTVIAQAVLDRVPARNDEHETENEG